LQKVCSPFEENLHRMWWGDSVGGVFLTATAVPNKTLVLIKW